MSTFRKLLLSLLLVSLTGSAFGAGTFASFTASTTNAASTFSTGSIVLSNKVNAADACFSTGIAFPGEGSFSNGNINNACDLLFNTSPSKPGDSAFADLVLTNEGNIAATGLTMSVDADPGAGTTCVTGDATGTDFHGDGDLCGSVPATALLVTVQEYSGPAQATDSGNPNYRCLFDGNGANDDACGTGGYLSSLDDYTVGSPLAVGAMAASAIRYIRFTFTMPNGAAGAENAVMGRKVDFSLTWTLLQ